MKKGADWRLFLCLACLFPLPSLAAPACPAPSYDETVVVEYVHDGDTVHLRDGRKVRLIGINAPELARDGTPEQAHAREARDHLGAALAAGDYRAGLVYGVERHDRYQRTLAHLFTRDGRNLQADLLRQGLAAAIPHPPNLAFTDCYSEQELIARCRGAGIWADPGQFIVQASTLGTKHRGFYLVAGKVDRIRSTDRGIRIDMGKLMLGIHGDNLAEFDLPALQALRGRHVTVRGWLHPLRQNKHQKKSGGKLPAGLYMRIRHPSAIQITQTSSREQCQKIIN